MQPAEHNVVDPYWISRARPQETLRLPPNIPAERAGIKMLLPNDIYVEDYANLTIEYCVTSPIF